MNWYRVEITAWVLGAVLQFLLILRWRGPRYWRAWLVYDLCFSLGMFAVNYHWLSHYTMIWDILQLAELGLLAAATLEAIGPITTAGVCMTMATMIAGALADPAHIVMAASAIFCFVSASALAVHHKAIVLNVYVSAMCVDHLSTLWHEKQWHAGAYTEVVTACCFAVWLLCPRLR